MPDHSRCGRLLIQGRLPPNKEIEEELVAVTEYRDKPAGTVRLTAMDYAIDDIIWPKLSKALKDYPDINVEIVTSYGFTDIVAERFDAGIRMGESVTAGMSRHECRRTSPMRLRRRRSTSWTGRNPWFRRI
ncbi:hypothetical protein [Neorhizobium sp. DT-125]|uniref:hypothetical protein n=1 Tax=Neorhizobium sp. DT-125 TaxID=3396163 RepID=UPI003F1B54AF